MSDVMGNNGSWGMGAGVGNNGATQSGGKPGNNNKLIGIIAIAAVAVIILVVAIIAIVGGGGKGKVKAAVMAYEEDLEDIEWEKYYPEDLAEAMEDYHEDDDYSAYEDITIVSVVKLKGDEADEVKENAVEALFKEYGEKYKSKNNKISDGYLVIFYSDNKDVELITALVIKVDGVYGVYGGGKIR